MNIIKKLYLLYVGMRLRRAKESLLESQIMLQLYKTIPFATTQRSQCEVNIAKQTLRIDYYNNYVKGLLRK